MSLDVMGSLRMRVKLIAIERDPGAECTAYKV